MHGALMIIMIINLYSAFPSCPNGLYNISMHEIEPKALTLYIFLHVGI